MEQWELTYGYFRSDHPLTPNGNYSSTYPTGYFQHDWFFGPQRSEVSTTKTLLWDTRATVSDSATLLWDIREAVAPTKTLLWDIRSIVGTTKTLLWDIREIVGTTKTLLWDVRSIVGKTATWVWDIGAPSVSRLFTLRWRLGNIRSNSSNNLTVRGAADLTVPGATNLTVPGTATEARMADRTNTLIVPSRTGEI